ncbi:hypothetical protein GCM10023091_24160 [Ravibacter arvi]|uniref:HTH cro/C1-type domain-containing protein n=1 Tax=Ravibacter arvi TaxID=2051041 RepID=A0ABP8M1S9_9BACT
MQTIDSRITARIRQTRLVKGYSQEYMAYRLGISQQSYSRLECGRQILRISQLVLIAEVLELRPEELLGSVPTMEAEPAQKDIALLLGRLEQVIEQIRLERLKDLT